MTSSLHGKTAIITGGSTELAGTVALTLANAGVNICLCGKQADLLDMSATKIKEFDGKVISRVTNLDTLEETESIVAQVKSEFGGLDILILISPFWSGGMIHNHNLKTWDLVMNANLREPFLMVRAALPFLREQKHGEIMTIGSDSAMGIYQQDGAYGVAMHGLTTLMELIRVENAEYGIRTHILSPSVALTDELDSEGKPALTVSHVAEWVIWMLTRPAHLRGNGPVLI
ncbi:MAG: SDR family oxidoreductase [Anaerolineales bacterium]|nr:SDR family oxidoreductase [Anaerolineales bacterium]